jgi:hypothetical protein
MCRKPTRWWYGTGARNVALCQECSETTREDALPTKSAWLAKERELNTTLAGRGFGR